MNNHNNHHYHYHQYQYHYHDELRNNHGLRGTLVASIYTYQMEVSMEVFHCPTKNQQQCTLLNISICRSKNSISTVKASIHTAEQGYQLRSPTMYNDLFYLSLYRDGYHNTNLAWYNHIGEWCVHICVHSIVFSCVYQLVVKRNSQQCV